MSIVLTSPTYPGAASKAFGRPRQLQAESSEGFFARQGAGLWRYSSRLSTRS